MDFVIDRSKWRCGGDGEFKLGEGYTELLNWQGYMCCLGQCARQLGYDTDHLLYLPSPSCIPTSIRFEHDIFSLRSGLTTYNSGLSDAAMRINDNDSFSQKEREDKLTQLFKQSGHSITFIN